jgi:hypothetical protein
VGAAQKHFLEYSDMLGIHFDTIADDEHGDFPYQLVCSVFLTTALGFHTSR